MKLINLKASPTAGRMRAFAASTVLAISLCFTAIAFQSGALAQQPEAPMSAATYNAKIAEFNSKLAAAHQAQDDLNRRVNCLDKRSSDLQQKRSDKERALGPLMANQQRLAATVTTQQAAFDGSKASFDAEQSNLARLTAQLRLLQAQQQAQEDWIAQCERDKPWEHLWGASCRADMDMSKTFGLVKDYTGDIDAANKRVQIASSSMEAARSQLQQSQTDLDKCSTQLAALNTQISAMQTDISKLASALSTISDVAQPLRISIDDFANELNEAKDVNTADGRPRTIRRLSGISGNIDAALTRSAGAVSQTNNTFGSDWIKGCPAN